MPTVEPFVIFDPGPPPEPPEPPAPRAPPGHLTWLFFGTLLFFVCFALPIVLLLWVGGAMFGTQRIAELLAKTHGLAPTTYGGAFWLAALFILVMLMVEAFALFRPRSERPGCLVALFTRPSIGLLVLFLPTRILIQLDLHGTDVPDILTTFLLLISLGYVYIILPFALTVVLGSFSLSIWRRGAQSSFAAGVFGTFGLVLASLMPLFCATQRDAAENIAANSKQLAADVVEVVASTSPAESSHAALVGLASRTPSLDLGDRGRFSECIEDLARGGGGRAERGDVRGFLTGRYGLDPSLADDIIDQKILHVCLRHSRQPIADLIPYFVKATKNEALKRIRKRKAAESCLVVAATYGAYDPYPARGDFLDFMTHFCELTPRDQKILEMAGEGHTSAEIAEKLGLSASNVRQIQARRLKQLRAKIAD